MELLLRDRYETLDLIGRGGQGEVVRAFDRVHKRMVAVKIRACDPDDDRAALLGEAGILLGVRPHPLLPLVREDFFDGDRYCVVMDWVDGTDLQHRLDGRGSPGLPLDEVVEALAQVASALDHLHGHDQPIVHGDVKPANVVRTADGRAVLVDFGIARRGGAGGGGAGAYGTSGYQAPETARGEKPTPAADVFALAATAFTLLTGQPPLPGARPRWGVIAGERAKVVEQTLRLGLAFDPTRRPLTATSLVEGLRGQLAVATNLPLEPTTFVGRADEMAAGRSLLAGTRLLTVLGTGGVGKSHLSRRLAAELAGDHPDGVYLVELATVVDP
ncbi:MAG: serine/threonine-protein kinase, partial [Acidimicrobiales bacterium]